MNVTSLISPRNKPFARNIFIDTVKRAEEDDFSNKDEMNIVFRLYEAYGGHADTAIPISLPPHWKLAKVALTNLLEDELEEIKIADLDHAGATQVPLSFHGFELKTLKITIKYDKDFVRPT